MKKDVKIMVGCRVEPDLKEILETEATQNTKTLSAYIESILKQRHFAEDDVEKLKERIFELETQNAALQSRFQEVSENDNISENTAELERKMLAKDVEIRTLKQTKMDITDMYNRVVGERNVLSKMQGNVIPPLDW
jgi:ribosomal protein L16 Arg81 hydroxylase